MLEVNNHSPSSERGYRRFTQTPVKNTVTATKPLATKSIGESGSPVIKAPTSGPPKTRRSRKLMALGHGPA